MNSNDYLKAVLVIGNGFDMDLKLKTKYSDFVKSKEWETAYNENAGKSKYYSLLKYLNDRKETEKWFDIEQDLLEYAHIKTRDVWHHDIKTDIREYKIVCETLSKYLKNHINAQSQDIADKRAIKLLKGFHSDNTAMKIYSFNFTSLELISRVAGILHIKSPNYIHGNVKDNTQILGINTTSFGEIMPEYSFLIKSNNSNYQSTDIESDMMRAKEVIIYGHSLNMIDSVYFDDYMRELSSGKDISRRLTIITFDEASRLKILDNIRKLDVSVPKLYSYGHLEFILTKAMDNGNDTEKAKFDKLVERISY